MGISRSLVRLTSWHLDGVGLRHLEPSERFVASRSTRRVIRYIDVKETLMNRDSVCRKVAALFFVGWMVVLSGCGGDSTPVVFNASLRVAHASPDAPNVDVLVDNKVVLSNVPYPTVSSYLTVTAATHEIKVNAAGTSTTVIDVSPTFTDGGAYTVFAVGFLAEIQPLLATDDQTAPAAGNSKLRVIHAAPDAGNVDILVNDKVVLTNVAFKAISAYLTVPAGTYDIKVNATGTSTTAIETSATVASGGIYTAVAIGSVKTAATNPLAVEILKDL
jgi:hypothetical protein